MVILNLIKFFESYVRLKELQCLTMSKLKLIDFYLDIYWLQDLRSFPSILQL